FAFQPPMAVGSPAGMPSAYCGSMPTIVPQSLPGPNLATAFPYAPNLATVLFGPSQDALAGLTAPALLAAVATRRGQPQGPTNDQEVEDFIYDALELLPGAADVDIRCEG